MIKFERTEVLGWEHAIRGMRNPMNSWEKIDSHWACTIAKFDDSDCETCDLNKDNVCCGHGAFRIGPNDQKLMMNLRNAGTDHRKFMRMIVVYCDITAPLYWWKEFDTYKVGTVANSCSTMHKIAAKEFTLEDFSCEHLLARAKGVLLRTIGELNYWRRIYINGGSIYTTMGGSSEEVSPKDKRVWWQMIQLLPSSYNQRRTVMLNYEVLANIYKSRRNHKLDEWCEHKNIDVKTLKRYYAGDYKLRDEKSLVDIGFCDWIKTLPYSELITGEIEE